MNASNAGSTSCCSISRDRKSTRLNSSHSQISYAVFCLKKKTGTHVALPFYESSTSLSLLGCAVYEYTMLETSAEATHPSITLERARRPSASHYGRFWKP